MAQCEKKTPEVLKIKAPAKINLYLRVTGRRVDGYHTLDTLMQKIALYDELELCRKERGGITLVCPDSQLPNGADNLVYKAAELFFASWASSVPPAVEITLHKKIPIAAGLGGGSSDAAATLVGLNALFGSPLAPEVLLEIGLKLGADVPFFVQPEPAACARGIGEELQAVVSISGYSIVLVNPGVPVSTKWVYQNFTLTNDSRVGNFTDSQGAITGLELEALQSGQLTRPTALFNDLEQITLTRHPEVARVKRELVGHGADVALMSGSGATVFALFTDAGKAERCLACMKNRFKHTFLVSPLASERREQVS